MHTPVGTLHIPILTLGLLKHGKLQCTCLGSLGTKNIFQTAVCRDECVGICHIHKIVQLPWLRLLKMSFPAFCLFLCRAIRCAKIQLNHHHLHTEDVSFVCGNAQYTRKTFSITCVRVRHIHKMLALSCLALHFSSFVL